MKLIRVLLKGLAMHVLLGMIYSYIDDYKFVVAALYYILDCKYYVGSLLILCHMLLIGIAMA